MQRLGFVLSAFVVLGTVGPALTPAAAAADSLSDKTKEEKTEVRPHHEITVTAAPIHKAVRDCAVSVSVLTDTDIRAARPLNALGALTRLPGIFAHRTGDFGRTDVEIRGLGQRGQRIAVLVDGRPEKMGIYGCAVTHAYPLDNVERIEVVRGPSSVLYGPDAMGGVINIITHRPAAGFQTHLTAAYGAFRTAALNLRHGGTLGRFDYHATADRMSSNGHVANSGYLGSAFTGRAGYNLGSGLSLALRAKYFDGKKDEPGTLALPNFTSWNHYKRGSADLSLEGRWNGAEFSFMAYNDFGRHVFSDGWNSRDFFRGATARGSLALTAAHRLSFGLDARFFGGKSYNKPRGDWRKSDVGAYVHDEIVLGKGWILSAGARLDRDSLFGWEASPQAGLVWHAAEKTSIRLSAAKAFRTPHLSELFLFPSSNPDLEPERAWNYELGFSQAVARFLTIDAAVFKMKGTNLIEAVRNPAGPAPYINRNTGSFDFAGIELGFKADILPSLSLSAAYSRLDAGDLTRGRPGRKIDLDLRWEAGRFQAYLTGQMVSDYYAGNRKTLPISSYTLVNGRAEFAVTRTVGLFVELNNIMGETYWIYVDLSGQAAGLYEMPGRNAHLGIRVDL